MRKYSNHIATTTIKLDPTKLNMCKDILITYKGKDITGDVLFAEIDLLLSLGNKSRTDSKEIYKDYLKEMAKNKRKLIKLKMEEKHGTV